MLHQPQLPRPVAVVKGSTWADIWAGFGTLSKQNQNLIQYLQNYLTTVYQWLAPPKVNVGIITGSQLPYTINATDMFVAPTAGVVNVPASNGGGRVLTIKNLDTGGGTVAVTANGTDTIDGQAVYNLTTQYQVVRLVDGAVGQWMII